jgi:predicted phage tail protein
LVPSLAVAAGSGGHSYTAWDAQGAPPGAPQSLTATVSGSTVSLNWLPPTTGGVPASYLLEASLSAGGPVLTSMPVAGTSLAVPNVPNGTYFARVRAINADGQSGPSNEVVIVVPAGGGGCTSPPDAPQSLSGTVSGSLVTLGWSPSVGGCAPTQYAVHAGLQTGLTNIGVLDAGLQTTLAANAPPGTYFVRVVAVNAFGPSAPSNEASVTVTGGCTSPPTAPHSLSGSVSGTLVSLNWSASAGGCAATSYTVQAGSGSELSDVVSVPVGLQTSVSAHAPTGTYFLRVIAVNAFGASTPSNEFSLTVTAPIATLWRVTQRFVSVSGPDNCWVREQRARLTGAVFPDLPMTITRSGGSISLESAFFQVNYAGTITGSQFSASGGPLEGGGTPCQDGTSFQQRPGVSNLSGNFSGGDQLLTASEVNSYVLTSGELVTYVWGWEATRQQ